MLHYNSENGPPEKQQEVEVGHKGAGYQGKLDTDNTRLTEVEETLRHMSKNGWKKKTSHLSSFKDK